VGCGFAAGARGSFNRPPLGIFDLGFARGDGGGELRIENLELPESVVRDCWKRVYARIGRAGVKLVRWLAWGVSENSIRLRAACGGAALII